MSNYFTSVYGVKKENDTKKFYFYTNSPCYAKFMSGLSKVDFDEMHILMFRNGEDHYLKNELLMTEEELADYASYITSLFGFNVISITKIDTSYGKLTELDEQTYRGSSITESGFSFEPSCAKKLHGYDLAIDISSIHKLPSYGHKALLIKHMGPLFRICYEPQYRVITDSLRDLYKTNPEIFKMISIYELIQILYYKHALAGTGHAAISSITLVKNEGQYIPRFTKVKSKNVRDSMWNVLDSTKDPVYLRGLKNIDLKKIESIRKALKLPQ